MSVKILIVSQANVGQSLLQAARHTYKDLPLSITTLSVKDHDDPDRLLKTLQKRVKKMDDGHGILVLTDLYGSTPSNIAHQLKNIEDVKIEVVAGLNLPMLIKVLNYPQLPLHELVQKAIAGGKQGVCCQGECHC